MTNIFPQQEHHNSIARPFAARTSHETSVEPPRLGCSQHRRRIHRPDVEGGEAGESVPEDEQPDLLDESRGDKAPRVAVGSI